MNRTAKDYLIGTSALIGCGAILFLIGLLVQNTEIGKSFAELFCIIGIGIAIAIFIGVFKQE